MTTASENASGSNDDVRAYLRLETPIREVALMASIADSLAFDFLEAETPKIKDGGVHLQLLESQYDQLIFAISKVRRMAKDLEKAYHAKDSPS